MLGPTGLGARGAHAGVTCGIYINIHTGTPRGVSAVVSWPNYIHIKCPSSEVKFKAHSLQSERARAFGLTPSTLQRPCLPPLVGMSKGCPQAWHTISHTGARTGVPGTRTGILGAGGSSLQTACREVQPRSQDQVRPCPPPPPIVWTHCVLRAGGGHRTRGGQGHTELDTHDHEYSALPMYTAGNLLRDFIGCRDGKAS